MANEIGIYAVRGAIDIKEEAGKDKMEVVAVLIDTIVKENNLAINNIISIQFSQTPDLNQMNAASALRKEKPKFGSIPLISYQEAKIKDMPMRLVRVLLTYKGSGPGKPVYLGEAKKLRPDLTG